MIYNKHLISCYTFASFECNKIYLHVVTHVCAHLPHTIHISIFVVNPKYLWYNGEVINGEVINARENVAKIYITVLSKICTDLYCTFMTILFYNMFCSVIFLSPTLPSPMYKILMRWRIACLAKNNGRLMLLTWCD